MGEGGAVTTDDPEMAKRLILARNHGMTRDPKDFTSTNDAFDANGQPNPWYYELVEPDFNWRANDIQCALGLSQLNKLDRFLACRRAVVATYDRLFAPYAPILQPLSRTRACLPAWHLYVARIDFEAAGISRGDLMRALSKDGIGTQVHYFPVHRQPYYAKRYDAKLPGADRHYANALSLPLSAAMVERDAERVADALVHHPQALKTPSLKKVKRAKSPSPVPFLFPTDFFPYALGRGRWSRSRPSVSDGGIPRRSPPLLR